MAPLKQNDLLHILCSVSTQSLLQIAFVLACIHPANQPAIQEATAMGLSGCIIKAFKKQDVIDVLNLPTRYEPRYVLALGYAAENVRIVDVPDDGDIKYYRDENTTQCVPKRSLSELLI